MPVLNRCIEFFSLVSYQILISPLQFPEISKDKLSRYAKLVSGSFASISISLLHFLISKIFLFWLKFISFKFPSKFKYFIFPCEFPTKNPLLVEQVQEIWVKLLMPGNYLSYCCKFDVWYNLKVFSVQTRRIWRVCAISIIGAVEWIVFSGIGVFFSQRNSPIPQSLTSFCVQLIK